MRFSPCHSCDFSSTTVLWFRRLFSALRSLRCRSSGGGQAGRGGGGSGVLTGARKLGRHLIPTWKFHPKRPEGNMFVFRQRSWRSRMPSPQESTGRSRSSAAAYPRIRFNDGVVVSPAVLSPQESALQKFRGWAGWTRWRWIRRFDRSPETRASLDSDMEIPSEETRGQHVRVSSAVMAFPHAEPARIDRPKSLVGSRVPTNPLDLQRQTLRLLSPRTFVKPRTTPMPSSLCAASSSAAASTTFGNDETPPYVHGGPE